MKTTFPKSTLYHRGKKSSSFVLKALPSALVLIFSQPGWADPPINAGGAASGLPTNGVAAVPGSVTHSVGSNQLTITQLTDKAVIDWASFNIDAGKTVHFAQPSAGAILNRVRGGSDPSQIFGTLSATGTVMLMNPNGVMFGQGSVVNVGSLIATTGTVDENNFSKTSAQITGATRGVITNQGSITASAGGLVALVAPSVINQGVISATGGTIALLGSSATTISLNNGLYEFAIPGGATGAEVTNAAGASLNAANIHLGVGDAANLLSGVINLEGVQQATNAIVVSGGTVELKSALQAPNISGNSTTVNVSSGARIQDAVKIAKTGTPGAGGTVNVGAGTYAEQVVLNKANMTLKGMNGANINVMEGQTGVDITANGVTLEGMQITGPYSQNFTTVNWNAVPTTTGISVGVDVSGARIHNNSIKNVRTGVQVLDRAAVEITGNTFDNTKGSILVRSDNVTMSGNARGPSGNEWDIVFLNHVTNGAYFTSPHVNQTDYGSGMMAMSRANGDMHILDRRYGSNGLLGSTPQFGNRSHIVVSAGSNYTATDDFNLGNGLGNARQPLGFINDGINAVVSGGVVEVKAGTYAENVNINKALVLDGAGMEQTILKAPTASGSAVTITGASDVTLSDLAIADSDNGLFISGTSNNVTVNHVAFNNNRSGMRTGTATKADNFRMRNSTITGGQIGVQTYNGYEMVGGVPVATGSFANALFENVTIDGPTYKGFYFETANNLTLKDVTITNAGNYGAPITSVDQHMKYGAAIDVNLKYDAFDAVTLQNVVVKNSGHSSGNDTSAAVVIKTRGVPGDDPRYVAAPASLQSVNIIGGSIEGSSDDGVRGTGIRFETLSNGSGGQPVVSISGGTQFKNNGKDIVVDKTNVDARGAVFVGAANGFAVEDRVTHALDSATRGLVTWEAGNVYVTQNSGSIQRGVNAVVTGGTVNVAAGSYVQPATLLVNKSLTLAGASQGDTTIDARGVNGYGIQVTADDVTLRDFTLYGPTANIDSAYGIKVAPSGNDASARLRNFSIRDVTIRGSGKAELDLNGVDGATINRVTADGAPVGNDAGTTAGAGIQLTDSANVTISNSTTRNNAWGGLALYQANRSYDQQVNNIAVAGNNTFTERNPVYMQDESASRDFGALNIAGFDYAVRNSSSTNSNHQYTWLQASRQNAFDLAVNIGAPASSYVQGWNGALTTQNFHVGTGSLLGGGTQAMSIGTAVNVVNPGGTINVGAGTFAENVNITKALTLEGAGAGQSVIAPTAGDGVTVSGNIGASSEVLIGGFTFRNAPASGIRVANNTVLNRLTVRNSDFLHNGKFGFFADGSATAGIPGLQNVSLLNSTFTGNGAPYTSATSLGQGDINFNYYNGNATLKDLRITGETEFVGIQFRGYHDNVASGGVHDAGRLEFDNVTIEGSFRRPSGSAGTWDPQGPGDAVHLLEYGSVANVSFNNVVINPSVGHGMFLEGLGSALDIGNTRFGAPDNATSGTSSSLTQSRNIYAGSNDRNNVKTNVNATRARFTGAANGFAIEDRVHHALDVTGLGVVSWEAGNLYVTQASGSIQRGVDAAGIGDTVNVANASFAENVAVNARRNLAFNDTRLQSLTLGSGAAGSGIGGAVTAEGAGGFDFHKDAPIRLLSDTTLATTGADIRINGDIQNNGEVARGLRLIAGSGGARGNVHLATGGTASNRLGQFDVTANAFDLSSTLWVKAYTIDALGDVALSGHTLNTDTASSLRAGGNVTGATHGLSKVEVTSGKSMNVEISGVDVVARAQETMQAIVKASNSATMAAETIKADVTAPVVTAAAVQEVQISGSSQNLTIDAPKGSVSGSFGQVSNTGSGLVNVNGKPQGNQTLSSNSENNRVVPAGEVGSGDESGVRVAKVGSPVAQREGDVSLSMPEAAGDAIDSGQAVELDLSPRKAKDTKEEKSSEKEEQ
ncbi:beta strand repeat-containing protein [Polaromonas sp.]|uniref:beta strand repeat-containing protein n=1 Tax=Polaromonas sp. TaxID=1869339 RepID=UPI003CA3ACDD